MNMPYVWLDGFIVQDVEAILSMRNHSFHYGTGVFEGIRSYTVDGQPNIFELDAHIDRLMRSAHAMRIHIEQSVEQLMDGCYQVLKANGFTDAYLRPMFYIDDVYGAATLSNGVGRGVIFATPVNKPHGVMEREAIFSSLRRSRANSGYHHAKSSGLYSTVQYAMVECQARNVDQAVFLDDQGVVCECLTDNIFMVSQGVVITPPAYLPIIQGITRATVMVLLRDEGLEVIEREFEADEMKAADEIFTTSTAAEIQAITRLDHAPVANEQIGPVTRQAAQLYDIVKRRATQGCLE